MAIVVVWQMSPRKGTVEVQNGRLSKLRIVDGRGRVKEERFEIPKDSAARLEIAVAEARIAPGANPTMVQVRSGAASFSFFLRDVRKERPIWIPEYGVAVTTSDDTRNYEAIAAAIRALGLAAEPHRYEDRPETSYESVCAGEGMRNLMSPIWLGLSRDMRIFCFGYRQELGHWGYVHPRYHGVDQAVPETDQKPIDIWFVTGPGLSCRAKITRWLEEGVLPILRGEQFEDDVRYRLTAFATLETQPLSATNLRGSDWRGVYPNSSGQMLTKDEVAAMKGVIDVEMRGREEEVVLCIRNEIVNTGAVPRYAWIKGTWSRSAKKSAYDGRTGFGVLSTETKRVFAINLLDGAPMPQEEMAILLQPGGKVVYDILVPHQPLDRKRAAKLAKLDIPRHLDACRAFWKAKLATGAQVRLPEAAVDERVHAGLLHLDLVAFGREPRGTVMPTIGWYAPIGSESSPIIQFFDSMGWHSLAERSIQFFLDRQRPDGFIQNFGNYQLETGPVLWTMGEHYRYTRNDAWVRRVRPNILKACEYLLAWRERNKTPKLRGRGYGMLEGKTSDLEDFLHSFMLNGLTYVGLKRAAEMLAKVDSAYSRRLAREVDLFRQDIRTTFYEAMARAPAVPLGDGSWSPSVAPFPEYRGPVSLYGEGGKWSSHGTVAARDSLNGPLYLVLGEVLDPGELGATFLVKSHHALCTVENAAQSQPYYSRHDFAQLKRGEIKGFLKTYYTQFASLQDRETYTFWEHYYFSGQHKTHEEAWFLMQTRWMLWLEEGDTLTFLRAAPRRWLVDGQDIRLQNVATYFGLASLTVTSHLGRDQTITAEVRCAGTRRPKTVTIRVPHPEGLRPSRVEGGSYNPASETVRLVGFKGQARVTLYY
jgi:hypothetical protein